MITLKTWKSSITTENESTPVQKVDADLNIIAYKSMTEEEANNFWGSWVKEDEDKAFYLNALAEKVEAFAKSD